MTEGDRKTRFFHLTTMKSKSPNANREQVAEDGKLLVEEQDIASEAVSFFNNRRGFGRQTWQKVSFLGLCFRE